MVGVRALVAGEDADAVERLRAALAAGGLEVEAAVGLDGAVAAAARVRPHVVVALDGVEVALRDRLDPLALAEPSPVVAAEALAGEGRAVTLLLEARAAASRAFELEAALGAAAVERRRELEAAGLDALQRLALAAEFRDDNTPEHPRRVAALAARLARRLGLPDRETWLVRRAAPLHDLGKIAVPDSILLKPGKLSPEEFAVVQAHTTAGAAVLAGGETELLRTAEQIARSHHERWDGGGYPDGLAGDAIPRAARLVHVADVFDVLVHERPYREPFTVDQAVLALRQGAGTQFDPAAVQAFEDLGPLAWSPPD